MGHHADNPERKPAALPGSLVFAVIVCSVVAGALAGCGYWFFSRLVDGWGLDQHDFLEDFEVNVFGTVLVEAAATPPAAALTWYGYLIAGPVLGAAAGAVMSLLAVEARRGAGRTRPLDARPALAVSAAVCVTAAATGLYLYPVVQSPLPVAYMILLGGGGLLFALLWCLRPPGVGRT